MQSQHEASWTDWVQVPVITQIIQPLPNLFFAVLTQSLDFKDLVSDEVFEALECDPSLSWVISIEYLNLKLFLC